MSSADSLLGRHCHREVPALRLWDTLSLPLARVHELCGRARRTLALHVAAEAVRRAGGAAGPVFWIAPVWGAEPLNPDGMDGILAPQTLTFVTPKRPEDLLWCMEEALRSGAAPVVIADLREPPGMTPVRRLHLAAEAGAREGYGAPLGLLLTPGEGGAPGIETRHAMEPAHMAGRSLWDLRRLRARMAPPQRWRLEAGALSPWPADASAPRLAPATG